MLKIILLLLTLYLIICLLLYLLQERLLFYPDTLDEDYSFREFSNFEERFVDTAEHTKIHALHFKTPNPKGIVLYFHGNARALNDWGHRAKIFVDNGFEVFMQDYRGYGKSKGAISEEGFHHDARILFDEVAKMYDPKDIILYGCSLGSGVATALATKVNAKKLILETPYMSMDAVAGATAPFLPVSQLLKYHFRNDLNIKNVHFPVEIFHGTKDELIPYRQAQQLAALSNTNDALVTIPGGTHNNIPEYQIYKERIKEILGVDSN